MGSGDSKPPKFNPEDPPSEAGYFHGSVNAQLTALREALAPFAAEAEQLSSSLADEPLKIDLGPGRGGVVNTGLRVRHLFAAHAALRVGQPVTRKTLLEGGAKEVDPQRGLTHEKKGGG